MNELNELYEIALKRKECPEEGSYTSYLYAKGLDKILKKFGEESTEVIIASLHDDREELIGEVNDLLYHLVVLLAEKGITLEEIAECMRERSLKQHNLKAERKPIEQY